MMAAIPPACCAGADDGKIHSQLCRIGRADRGDFVCADSSANRSGIGADTLAFAESVAKPVAFSVAYTLTISESVSNADTDADTHADADRFGLQRGINRRSGQTTLQPDDHQPGTRHGASGRQRADQLQRLR
jgi:hypothetical protein